MKRSSSPIDGLLVVDKPVGWTSHDVVARTRRLTGERRVGHAGTLDPLASGVLPLGLGQGTRVLEYLSGAGKAYRAVVRLGVSTDTYDAEGTVTSSSSVADLPLQPIEAALTEFRGTIQQRPPLFSALKRNGRPFYTYARAGIFVDVPPRAVRIDRLEIRSYAWPDLELEIDCASGFYVRSLAHDLGLRLGCGAHLRSLIRTRVGLFGLEDTVSLDAIEAAAEWDRLSDYLWALDAPLRWTPAVILAQAHTADVVNGRPLQLLPKREIQQHLCRAYSTEGEFLAVLALRSDGAAQPIKVFPAGRRGIYLEDHDRSIVV